MINYKTIVQKTKPEMDKVINHFSGELKKVRADRAAPSLVEDIVVDCFDQRLPLKQLAAISCPAKRQILIQPWDKEYTKNIVNAIQKSESELSPMVENESIRIVLPPLTQEYREKLLSVLSKKREEARISLKKIREDAWKEVQKGFNDGEIREDDKFRGKDELQKIIDDYNRKVDDMIERREKEIKQ